MRETRSVRAVWISVPLLLGVPHLATAGEPPAPMGIVAVSVARPDFLWRDVSTRVLVDLTRTRRVPLSDFDMTVALSSACAQELGENPARAWRVAGAAELPAMQPYFAGKPAVLPAADGTDRVLAVFVVEYGALKILVDANRKFFLNATALLFDPRSGKELWRRGFIERIDVLGKFEDLVANDEQGLKEATRRLVTQFCGQVRKKVESTP
jgi:hypothetical protein